MKIPYVELLIAAIAGMFLVACFWVLKVLIQLPLPPDFLAGVVGGAIWMFATSKVLQVFREVLHDVDERIREGKSQPDEEWE